MELYLINFSLFFELSPLLISKFEGLICWER
jgi:hypothetical protein